MKKWGTKKLILAGLIGLWVVALGAGLKVLQDYGSRAGKQGPFSVRWPQDSVIHMAAKDRASIVVFLHPECPCSRSSLEELDRVIAKAAVKPDVFAVFVVPPAWTNERAKTGLWLRASRMTGVTPVLDREGQEAKRFGAATSGQLYAYTKDGELGFAGGITPSRGHEGVNPGRDALSQFLADGRAPASEVPTWKVFGCSLFDAKEHEKMKHDGHEGHSGHEDHAAHAAPIRKKRKG